MHWMLRLFVICLLLASSSSASAAGFARVGTFGFTWSGMFSGGRLASLGGSHLADSSPATILVNPAPLSTGNSASMSYDYLNYYNDFEFHTFSGSAELNNLRLNFATQDYGADSIIIRTAYNPEGIGGPFDSHSRMTVLGLSYDLGRALIHDNSIRWAVGASWRTYSGKISDNSSSANAYDIGTTLSWRTGNADGWMGLTGVVAMENVSETEITFDERRTMLPSPTRTGISFEAARSLSNHQGELFKILVAYSRTQGTEALPVDHFGFEILVRNLIALRAGHNNRFGDGSTTYGLGVILDRPFLGPFIVEADLGMMNFSGSFPDDGQLILGIRGKYHF